MAEPRTHYQVSFTSKQAVLLFAGVLVALAVAYLLGVATGLAGREPAETTAAAATPAPAKTAPAPARTPAEYASSGVPTAVARTSPTAVVAAAREPTAAPTLQFFEEEPEKAAVATPEPGGKAGASEKASGGFWVQVLSTKSRREADSRRALLAKQGHHATISAARGAYRVRVGPFASREEASRASEVLAHGEKVKPWIVPPGK